MKNCLVYAVYTDVERSLSSRPSPDFYIGDLPDRRLPAPRFPMKVNSQRGRITDSNSTNAVSFSSACTTKRFPSRCASATQIVRPPESTAETQPQSHPALLRLSAMISQAFTCSGFTAAFLRRVFGNADRSEADRTSDLAGAGQE